MIRKITKLGLTLLAIMTLIIIGVNGLNQETVKEVGKTARLASELKLKDRVPSKYRGIDLYVRKEETAHYTMNLTIPITKSSAANNEISSWLETAKQTFLDELGEDKTGASFDVTLNIHRENDHYHQLNFQTMKEVNGEEVERENRLFNLDLEADTVLTLNDFIDASEATEASLFTEAVGILKESEMLTPEEAEQLVSQANDADWQWLMSKTGLGMFIDGNQFTENKRGPLFVNIPFESLYLLVNDQMDTYIQLTDAQQEAKAAAIAKEEQRILLAKQEQERIEREKAAEAKAQAEAAAKAKAQGNRPYHSKYVALTFDDGPSATVTPRVLATLKQYNAKATFFVLGPQVARYPDLAKQIVNEGHEIANHTERHLDLRTVGQSVVQQEIAGTRDQVINATGVRPTLVRPPYGAFNNTVINQVANNGESIIMWSVDSLDWKSRNAAAINQVIMKSVTSGSIVLMHDIHPTTADALPQLMATLHQQGYEFVTVSRLLEIQGRQGVGPFFGQYK